jgi:hypothetical protein
MEGEGMGRQGRKGHVFLVAGLYNEEKLKRHMDNSMATTENEGRTSS